MSTLELNNSAAESVDTNIKPIRTALVSVYNKDRIGEIVKRLHDNGVRLLSTGGTQTFIESLGIPCDAVEDLTGYPSILGGRVKTLHPKVFGGILARRDNESDAAQCEQYEIAPIDLVIVDLYPFEKTVASGASYEDIIEKIDIGGISLIRAAAKNLSDVAIVASEGQFDYLLDILERRGAFTSQAERLYLAGSAFAVSSGYDSAIYNWFAPQCGQPEALRVAVNGVKSLRYGENPHQAAAFYGDFDAIFEQLHGKEISYNNLLDIDAACALIDDMPSTAVAVLKHNNACGCALDENVTEAWRKALAGDPVSAFGGIIIANAAIDKETAEEMGKIFFEVVIAPAYTPEALEVLKQKKNRIILLRKEQADAPVRLRTALNGVLVQAADSKVHTSEDLRLVAGAAPTAQQVSDLIFANILVKHSKSNAIVLAHNGQLLASGVGQTSRVDALKQAIEKARSFGFDLAGASMASDAFFPFADCVEIAHKAGINNVIQPGGSIRDNDSVEYCAANNITMVMTGTRHFRH
ncbi:MAG: bifunctional phosphoribosylaminoimidazolecarboxamide formyltransferase/IMP cyclohydrolase [Muribaculaceae bacterium]|nr:bifunctional phosphoribosylaminoimidazolecarboxamide formyltransferase/IMP cyclohydrolase [Muribaculaceae bacterium]